VSYFGSFYASSNTDIVPDKSNVTIPTLRIIPAMQYYLLLLLFPLSGVAQLPMDTENAHFKEAQLAKMIKLGYRRIDVKWVDTDSITGKFIQSYENWMTFDSNAHFCANGERKNGKDSMHYSRSYRADGKYLGEVDQNGNGRTMCYDEHDS